MQLVDGRTRVHRRRGLASVTLRGTGEVLPRQCLRLGEGRLSVCVRTWFQGLVPAIGYLHLSVSVHESPSIRLPFVCVFHFFHSTLQPSTHHLLRKYCYYIFTIPHECLA